MTQNSNESQQQMSQLSPASLRAYKRIVQFIHKHDLQPGQTLPPQQELRLAMKLTNDALTRAMGLLCKQGVLERKTRLGTRVVDRSKALPIRWTLGLANIAAPDIGPLSTFTTLSHHIQVAAARRGWNVQTFYRFNQTSDIPNLEEFGELEQQFAERTSLDRAIDGLVLLTPLERSQWASLVDSDIPLMHGPFWETAPCGVVTDQLTLTSHAVQLLAHDAHDAKADETSVACSRFGVVVGHDHTKTFNRYRQGLAHGLAQAGLNPADSKVICHGPSIEGGQNVARDLLKQPVGSRPDALIVLDDYIALGLTQVLATTSDAQGRMYRPRIAVQTNREVLQNFQLPVVRFEVSLTGIANRLVEGMHQRMHNPSITQAVEYVTAAACEESDSPFDTRHSDTRHLAVPIAIG